MPTVSRESSSQAFRLTLIVVVVVLCVHAWQRLQAANRPAAPTGGTSEARTTIAFGGTFTFAGCPKSTTYPNELRILTNTAYLVAYDEKRRNPGWGAYRIPGERRFGTLARPRRFATDIRTTARVTHNDYTNTGFDRGHMVPNFAIASRFGELAQRETFLMSNVAPQAAALNQGAWRLLEETLAETTAVHAGEIWIVVGPIYDGDARTLPSGSVIPSEFFMVVADETPEGPRLAAFVMPQSATRGANFRTFRTTVEDVQVKTGLDFFWELPDPLEARIEAELGAYWLEALP